MTALRLYVLNAINAAPGRVGRDRLIDSDKEKKIRKLLGYFRSFSDLCSDRVPDSPKIMI